MTVTVNYKLYNGFVKGEEEMTYSAYIERQKEIIKSRHEFDGECLDRVYCADTERLFDDLRTIKGLNVAERTEKATKV